MSETLITESDVREFVGDQSASFMQSIPAAEAAIAAYIGCKSMHAVTRTEKIKVPYALGSDDAIEVRGGPIAEILALTIAGTGVDLDSVGEHEDLTVRPWSILWYPGVSAGSEIEITYIAGWTTETVPDQIKQAIISQAAVVNATPDLRVVNERIGDYSVSYNQSKLESGIDVRVAQSLSEYTKAKI